MRVPQALYHASMAMSVDGMPHGWTARVLILRKQDGSTEPYARLIEYMKAFQHRGPTWQDTVVRGLGLLWDFCQAVGPKIAAESPANFQRTLFRRFAHALQSGTISPDGIDESGLYWPMMGWRRTRELVHSIEHYAQWCYEEIDPNPFEPAAHKRAPSKGIDITATLVWSRIRQVSMLVHIDQEPKEKRRKSWVETGRNPVGVSVEPVKYFPPEYVESLLWEGYKRPGRDREINPFLRYNSRDMMVGLLDGWGGLRRAEGFHLWIQDVVEEPGKPGHALVVLNHPSEAMLQYFDKVTGRELRLSRQEVLKRRYPPYMPRHKVTRGRYRAGWKGIDLNREHQAFVFWIDPNAAALFWILYLGYIRYVRTPIMKHRRALGGADHPFLFVTEGDDRREGTAMIGDPYTPKAYERNHEAAVRRIQVDGGTYLEHSKYHGTTTHGLRHLYGQTLVSLGVAPQVIQKGLHHRHYLSQAPYTAPDRDRTNQVLNNAYAQLTGRHVEPLAPLGHESSQAILRLKEFIASGGPRV